MRGPLRSLGVRGEYHRLLQALLARAVREKVCTQESLAEDVGRDQTTFSKYLAAHPKAGTLDLDDAHKALIHVGSTLPAFITDPRHAPVSAPDLSTKARRLLDREPAFTQLVEVLHAARPARRAVALHHALAIASELTRARGSGLRGGKIPGGGTNKKPKKRR